MHFTLTQFASQTSKGAKLLEGLCDRGQAMASNAQVRATSRDKADAIRTGRLTATS